MTFYFLQFHSWTSFHGRGQWMTPIPYTEWKINIWGPFTQWFLPSSNLPQIIQLVKIIIFVKRDFLPTMRTRLLTWKAWLLLITFIFKSKWLLTDVIFQDLTPQTQGWSTQAESLNRLPLSLWSRGQSVSEVKIHINKEHLDSCFRNEWLIFGSFHVFLSSLSPPNHEETAGKTALLYLNTQRTQMLLILKPDFLLLRRTSYNFMEWDF